MKKLIKLIKLILKLKDVFYYYESSLRKLILL